MCYAGRVFRRSIRWTTSLVVAAILPLLAQCEYEPSPCATSSIAFTLPAPGDVIQTSVFVCGEADERVELSLSVEMEGGLPRVMLAVAGGTDLYQYDSLSVTVTATPASCNTGLTVTLAHLDNGGPLTGTLQIDASVDAGRCEMRVGGP